MQDKNRYGNILAYDHSRVILEPPAGHEEEFESDYINASYINVSVLNACWRTCVSTKVKD